jgi:hypothetical protein
MIISRILFLCTYYMTMNFDDLIKKNSLGENINYVRRPRSMPVLPSLAHVILTCSANHKACKAVSERVQKDLVAGRSKGIS